MRALSLLERIVASHIIMFGSPDVVGVDARIIQEAIDLIREAHRENSKPL